MVACSWIPTGAETSPIVMVLKSLMGSTLVGFAVIWEGVPKSLMG